MNEKLESAKNEIAKEHGYKSFEHFDDKSTFRYNHSTPDIIDEIAIRYHELMEEEVIFKCINITDKRYNYYYNEAKRVGEFDVVKEQECVRASIALKELKDELMEMQQRT